MKKSKLFRMSRYHKFAISAIIIGVFALITLFGFGMKSYYITVICALISAIGCFFINKYMDSLI